MSPNQTAKLTFRFNTDRTLRPLGNGQIRRMLLTSARTERGSNQLTAAQYTTVTANYKKQYPRP